MKKGDKVLFYHSNEGMEIVGIAKVAKEAYQEAIGAALPADVAQIVSRQARSVQNAHDRVKSLRDSIAA